MGIFGCMQGNILDDEVLINTLAESKITSDEIKIKVAESEKTEVAIDETREVRMPKLHNHPLLVVIIVVIITAPSRAGGVFIPDTYQFVRGINILSGQWLAQLIQERE